MNVDLDEVKYSDVDFSSNELANVSNRLGSRNETQTTRVRVGSENGLNIDLDVVKYSDVDLTYLSASS